MPGCSSPPVISASSRKRARLSGSSACSGRISFSATSRFSSASRATETSPRPPRACGRRIAEPAGRRRRGHADRSAWPSGSRRRRGGRPATMRARVASSSGSASRARLVAESTEPAATAARLLSASPPCFFRCRATSASTAARPLGVEVAEGDEVVGQRPGLVAGPGLEGGDEGWPGRSGRSAGRAGRRGDRGRRRRPWVDPPAAARHRRTPIGGPRRGGMPGRAADHSQLSHHEMRKTCPPRPLGSPAPEPDRRRIDHSDRGRVRHLAQRTHPQLAGSDRCWLVILSLAEVAATTP